jgi:UPF0271 protein
VVCDTSVLLAGGDPRAGADDEAYVPPGIVGEVKRPDERERLETLLATGLRVQAPRGDALARVEEAAGATGDRERLSGPDKELVALALDLGALLLSDDRSVQNVAKHLGIAYRGFAQSEIQDLWHWQSRWRCTGCARMYDAEPPRAECVVCGHQVVKKHWRVPKGEAPGRGRRTPRV